MICESGKVVSVVSAGTFEGVTPGDNAVSGAYGGMKAAAVDEFARPLVGRRRLQPVVDIDRREQLYRWHLAAADGLCGAAAAVAATWIFGVTPSLWMLLVPVIAVTAAKLQGLYDRDDRVIVKSTVAQWPAMFQAAAITAIIVAVGWRWLTTATHGDGLRLFAFLVVTIFGLSVPTRGSRGGWRAVWLRLSAA